MGHDLEEPHGTVPMLGVFDRGGLRQGGGQVDFGPVCLIHEVGQLDRQRPGTVGRGGCAFGPLHGHDEPGQLRQTPGGGDGGR